MKQIVEPTGCLGAAAVFNNKTFDLRGKRVGVVISGGNVDMASFCRLLSQ
jgi:threonine dehydratase